ncbi:MAG: hypothetical protein LWW87_08445 [Geobacteraceae bacterium]|nr:hypothetical protein [Geobacteraceae bacterium]
MNPQTSLLRQIHPSFIQEGRVTSQAFRPTPKDTGKLSLYHGDLISPENAWIHFVSQEGCNSVGVMANLKSEYDSLSVCLEHDGIQFTEHVSADFSPFTKSDIEKKSKILSRAAQARGWLHNHCV